MPLLLYCSGVQFCYVTRAPLIIQGGRNLGASKLRNARPGILGSIERTSSAETDQGLERKTSSADNIGGDRRKESGVTRVDVVRRLQIWKLLEPHRAPGTPFGVDGGQDRGSPGTAEREPGRQIPPARTNSMCRF